MHRHIPFAGSLFIFLTVFLNSWAQDTIVLLNGKTINAHVLEVQDNDIKYRIGSAGKKVHSVDPLNVFSVIKADGTEEIIFKPDPLEENEFTVDQLRLFIKGEQDSRKYYHNPLNKTAAFFIGTASSFFSIYGLVGPAIYTSVVGSVSPNISKQPGVDRSLIDNEDYREGYLRVARDKKIRNSYIAGMIGFAAGFVAQAIIADNDK